MLQAPQTGQIFNHGLFITIAPLTLTLEFVLCKRQNYYNTFEQFLKDRSVDLTTTIKENELVSKICKRYYPKIIDNKVVAAGERTFADIEEMFKNEDGVMLSLAHPAFFALHFKDSIKALNDIFSKSKGLLKSAEICHQAYDIPVQKGEITQDFISKVNLFLKKMKLIPTGGHDNHQDRLLPL